MSVLLVTGTGTDIGKTVATAALAACASGRTAVVKPAQTGVPDGGAGDLAVVSRLSGVTDVHEYVRYPDPLSPHHAAARSGRPQLQLADAVRRIIDLDALHDLVLVEGAGGLLVPFTTSDRWTFVDLAHALQASLVVVTAPGLGTLNHTRLTVDRLAEEGLELAGLIVGSWPAEPDIAMRANIGDLYAMAPLLGVLPAGLGTARDFRRRARAALAPAWGGGFDAAAFVARALG